MSPMIFLREILLRFVAKSPKFFKVLQVSTALLAGANMVPSMLQRWFAIDMPENIITLCEDIAKISGGFFLATLLPVDTKPVALTEGGLVLNKTDEKKLPYTAKVEEKEAVKEMQQAVTVPEEVDIKIEESKDKIDK